MLCVLKTAKHFVEILLPPDSPMILAFCRRKSLLNSDGFTPNGAPNTRGGGEKIGRFLTNNWYILEMLRDTAIVAVEVE